MATYYATKAFVVSFSEALAHELKDSGVSVTCHCPGATATEFARTSGNEKSRLFQRPGIAKAEDVASHAYQSMMEGEVLAVHGLMNWLGFQGLRVSPRAVIRNMVAAINSEPEKAE
jgi:short-subunit dehydrogenase